MNILFQLFFTFLRIGMFTFGGGYAMIPLMQQEFIINNSWMSQQDFLDIIAVSEMTPGVIAVNIATFLGYRVSDSIIGGLLATFGVVLPSCVIVLLLTHFFFKFKNNKNIQNILKLIRPVVLGLIASAAFILMKGAIIDYYSIIIMTLAIFLSLVKNWNPFIIILLCGIIGLVIY